MPQESPGRVTAPDASIVIVNYNGAEFIEASIRTALEQTANVEVIVVENASTDRSLDVLRSIAGIRLVVNDRNAGFGGGANLGARHAAGEYVAFLNSDALADPEWIARIVPWMRANDVAFASSVVTSYDRVWFDGGTWLPAIGAALMAPRKGARDTDWLSGCALVVRRSAWEFLDGFDEAFFMYFEDVDVSLRARAAGYRVAVFPEPLVRHDVPGRSAAAMGFGKLQAGYRSKGRLARKHVPWFALPSALAFQSTASPLGQGVPLARLPAIWTAFACGLRSA